MKLDTSLLLASLAASVAAAPALHPGAAKRWADANRGDTDLREGGQPAAGEKRNAQATEIVQPTQAATGGQNGPATQPVQTAAVGPATNVVQARQATEFFTVFSNAQATPVVQARQVGSSDPVRIGFVPRATPMLFARQDSQGSIIEIITLRQVTPVTSVDGGQGNGQNDPVTSVDGGNGGNGGNAPVTSIEREGSGQSPPQATQPVQARQVVPGDSIRIEFSPRATGFVQARQNDGNENSAGEGDGSGGSLPVVPAPDLPSGSGGDQGNDENFASPGKRYAAPQASQLFRSNAQPTPIVQARQNEDSAGERDDPIDAALPLPDTPIDQEDAPRAPQANVVISARQDEPVAVPDDTNNSDLPPPIDAPSDGAPPAPTDPTDDGVTIISERQNRGNETNATLVEGRVN